jgi:hypothetical protein
MQHSRLAGYVVTTGVLSPEPIASQKSCSHTTSKTAYIHPELVARLDAKKLKKLCLFQGLITPQVLSALVPQAFSAVAVTWPTTATMLTLGLPVE